MPPHVILTTNGIAGACSAAIAFMAHPEAQLRLTSPRHIEDAIMDAMETLPTGTTLHLCGIGYAVPISSLRERLKEAGTRLQITWYAGMEHPEVHALAKPKIQGFEVIGSKKQTSLGVIQDHFGIKPSAQVLRLLELDLAACEDEVPKQAQLKRLHDLVLTANRHFYFFGQDNLNEEVVRHLAGLCPVSPMLEDALSRFRESDDATFPLGSSKAMRKIRELVGRIGPIDEPVLISGPTGSGKEVVARALHVTSGRRGSFVAVNCAVLGGNPAMVEDRLFGHVKGAFTGADRAAGGAFDEADGGTLFLDEIAELPVEVQTQLLRVLEEKRVRPLGTMETHRVEVRVIAATHRSLRQMVAEGKFREDLYYRLDVLGIDVPPLSARPEDLRSIAAAECEQLHTKGYPLSLTSKDWQAIKGYSWPGNVRELKNLLRRAAFLGSTITETLKSADATSSGSIQETNAATTDFWPISAADVIPLDEFCSIYARHVVSLFQGNITHTASALGVAPNTVRRHCH